MSRVSRPWQCGLVLLALAAPFPDAFAGRVVTVVQAGRAFAVSSLHLQRGDTVHFTNEDVFDHQVFVDAPVFKFESPEQAPGTAQDVQFTKAGTFDVQCQIHPRMHLAVTVD